MTINTGIPRMTAGPWPLRAWSTVGPLGGVVLYVLERLDAQRPLPVRTPFVEEIPLPEPIVLEPLEGDGAPVIDEEAATRQAG